MTAPTKARIDTAVQRHARALPGFDERVAAAATRLATAATAHAGRIVQATSLGAEDMVITDLVARAGLPVALATLDTGLLHAETLALIPRLEARYGLAVERFQPRSEATIEFIRHHGDKAMYRSLELRKGCCGVRKLEPLSRLLAGRTAWITGLRREQSDARAEVPFESTDDGGRLKLSPLADWRWTDVWRYIELHDVPYNPLHDGFFPSIGCAPCTRAIALGEPFRAGRWWWEQEDLKECGLHVPAAERPGVPA
jgi:phosphoadenosine phosphosulfate reductase